ncbi:hypothetical protein QBC47DRAFT_43370 [Echria macrotheca]|uniref:F-box domain-containing protein n=1 Tax=Echria macrotheca TaxID=438768 RepID=A0AAJ0B903_9PEZI|nr:hypothetical protein QBC47DRAFT_43370 [Echria macrotheca]
MSAMSGPMFLDDDRGEPLAADPLFPRTDLDRAMDEDEGKATVELASIMTTASNPVSPGPSSPPLDQVRIQDIVPPTRPSSTPFPQPENADLRFLCRPRDTMMDLDDPEPADLPAAIPACENIGLGLNDLPAEIHECILDHLFGFRVSPKSKSSITRWGTALRHPRRKELSELSLVSRAWRILIQERLYRHIKLEATVKSLRGSFTYFAEHPHLRPHIKHIEIWFPVFQPKYGPLALSNTNTIATVTADGLTNACYILPRGNCSLEEAFYFIAETFPEVSVLTLEGGERKKAPKVRHWIGSSDPLIRVMPKIDSVRTLICKGQWNLIRGERDFEAITSALPNLEEWHGSYSKPKSKSYLTMAEVLVKPMRLKTLNLCIEGDYRRELAFPPYAVKASGKLHFCSRLACAAASPSLEHLSYTGRVCKHFFNDLAARQKDPRHTRLQSIDLTVKNCCRPLGNWNETGSGIMDMNFINAFEALVLAGIRALEKLKGVKYLRIRYVDLDSPMPPLNPYFLLQDGWCSGVWSNAIISELNRVRPSARFHELAETFGSCTLNKDGRMTFCPEFPKSRALSLKLSNYALLHTGIAIT